MKELIKVVSSRALRILLPFEVINVCMCRLLTPILESEFALAQSLGRFNEKT
jgi:hypothetical protein